MENERPKPWIFEDSEIHADYRKETSNACWRFLILEKPLIRDDNYVLEVVRGNKLVFQLAVDESDLVIMTAFLAKAFQHLVSCKLKKEEDGAISGEKSEV